MPRALSTAAITSAFNQEGGDAVFLTLLEIDRVTDLLDPIRVVNNLQNVTHGGHTYLACAFGIALPAEQDDGAPQQVRLRIDNVDRAIVEGIRLLTGPPTVTLTVVLAATPDTIEAGPFVMTLRDTEYDALEVSGALASDDILGDSFPQHAFSASNHPGLVAAA
jgi:hypothetical protein